MRFILPVVTAMLMGTAAHADLSTRDIQQRPRAAVEKALPAAHPSAYYAYAARLFREGAREDAVFWFYAGQIRYRFHLTVRPDLPPDGDPALFGSLTDTVGQEINGWAGGDTQLWARQMQRALDWDAQTDNGFTSKTAYGAQWQQIRAGLAGLIAQVRSSRDEIRSRRKDNGLPFR